MEAWSCGCCRGWLHEVGVSARDLPLHSYLHKLLMQMKCQEMERDRHRLWVTGDTKPLDPAESEAGGLSQDFQIYEPSTHFPRLDFSLSLSSGRILFDLLTPSLRNNKQPAESFNNHDFLMFTKNLEISYYCLHFPHGNCRLRKVKWLA